MTKQPRPQTNFEKIAISFTEWVGSISSLIVHTLAFIASFILIIFGVPVDKVLLVLTTAVSLEAIYLAIFIQMTVNRNTQSLEEVEEDIDEIQKDVDEIQEDVEEIEKDVDEIEKDVDEIQKDVDEIEKDIDEVQEDVEEMTEDEAKEQQTKDTLEKIEGTLARLMDEIEKIKGK